MKGILVDIYIQGQGRILSLILHSDLWRGLWEHLGLSLLTCAEQISITQQERRVSTPRT